MTLNFLTFFSELDMLKDCCWYNNVRFLNQIKYIIHFQNRFKLAIKNKYLILPDIIICTFPSIECIGFVLPND